MTRRWFFSVLGAIAATCGLGSSATGSVRLPKNSVSGSLPRLHYGVARGAIAQGEVGWVDLQRYKEGAYCSAVVAKAMFPVSAGTRVAVADALEAREIGDFPLIYMAAMPEGGDLQTDGVSRVAVFGAKPTSTFTLSSENGTLEQGW